MKTIRRLSNQASGSRLRFQTCGASRIVPVISSRRRVAGIVAGLATVVAMAACSSSSSQSAAPTQSATGSGATTGSASTANGAGAADSSKSPIKIGFLTIDQGTNAVPGPKQGAEAAVAYANAQLGGIGGHPIVLDYCSIGIDAQTNQQCGQHFANSSDAVVLMGLVFNSAPFYSALAASGKPIVGLLPLTAGDLTSQAVFWSTGEFIDSAAAAVALKAVPSAKVLGFIADNSTGGQAQLNEVKALVGNRATVKYASLSVTNPDALGAVSSLGKVDAYIVGGQGTECVQEASALKQLAPGTPVVTVQECASYAKAAGGAMNGWTYTALTQIPAASGNSPDVSTYISEYPKYGDTSFLDNVWTTGTWGMVLTARNVLAKAGAANLGAASLTTAFKDFTGPMVLGPTHLKCPGVLASNVCADTIFRYNLGSNGSSTPVPGSGFEVAIP
jgi:branched-chain amino acid transport system substrate-binding protein